jgi:xylonate dehydratase
VLDGDMIEIIVDRNNLVGSVNLIGENNVAVDWQTGATILAARGMRTDLQAHPNLPDDTRLWAALQHVSGGTWGGCVYDADSIIARLNQPQ